MNSKVRVRIAPSPTGFAHIGTLWMALFNLAYARQNGGVFILRLDDTDIKREVEGAEKAVTENLKWFGITWDEGFDIGGQFGPYKQSKKLDKYKKLATDLIEKGLAYEDEGAIRIKGIEKDVTWNDLKRGVVTFPAKEVNKNYVILKSNGYPTYHFATVVDEIDMEISHVIRGDEHISNTPQQLIFYDLLGAKPPEFAHIPTIRNDTGKKLSKRRDPVNLSIYREKGYLPEALVNYLCLIGWSHPEEKDIFDLSEFIDKFSLERVQKSAPKFDLEKLNWVNKQWILKKLETEEKGLISEIKSLSRYKSHDSFDPIISNVIKFVAPRITILSDFDNMAGFFFDDLEIESDNFTQNYKNHLSVANNVIEGLHDWNLENLNDSLMKKIVENNFKVGDFFQDLRVCMSGKRISPPINESLIVLGKDVALRRLAKVLKA